MPTPTVFDPSRYPRTYTASLLMRAATGVFCGVVVLCSLAALRQAAVGEAWTNPSHAAASCAAALVMGLAFWTISRVYLRHRVVVAPDWIEVRGPWRTRRVLRSEISGVRLSTHAAGTTFQVRAPSLVRPLAPTLPVDADADFRAWFTGLRNADVTELVQDMADVALDASLGATPALRLQAAARARRIAHRLTGAAVASTIWTLVYPHPRGLLLALDAAWLPIVFLACARSGGRFVLSARRHSARGDLFAVLTLAAIALCARGWTDVRPLAWSGLVVASAVAGVLLAFAAGAVSRGLRPSAGLRAFHAVVLAFAAAGALALVNGEFDRAPGASQVVTIVHARKTGSLYSDAYLTLSRVPADVDSPEVEVPGGVYRRHQVGERVCLRERDGALGWHWLQVADVDRCDPS